MLALLAANLLRQLGSIEIREALVIEGVARGGRVPFPADPIQKMIVEGTWKAPSAGDKIGTHEWAKRDADKEGMIQPANAGGAYAFATVDPGDCILLMKAAGHSMVYVNGEPRMGDPYGYGYVTLPVHFHTGKNELLFALSRGGFRASFETPKFAHSLNLSDPTMPDIREGEKGKMFGAVIVINASDLPAKGLMLGSQLGDGPKLTTRIADIPPLSVRKVKVDFEVKGDEKPGELPLKLTLVNEDAGTLKLRIRKREQTYKRTFVSHIDGSVQYYAVNPAPIQKPGQGLVLSLHGASVEAIGQADAYSAKNWCNIVCPTNRRPYGFDWEGIGREDAMEVLAQASKDLSPDPRQIYLCGHSMGGHGAWTVGAHYPDRFAVVFPSAGWQSFYTYAGQRRRPTADDPMGQIFERSAADSDTALLVANLKLPALYGLHGIADDNVPISELRDMKILLAANGIEFAGYHEQPGAGHWWDVDPAPGADCVDWKPAFDLMKASRRTLADDLKPIDFTTVNPASSDTCEWITVLQQVKPGQASRIQANADLGKQAITVKTTNVAKFHLNPELLANWAVKVDDILLKQKSDSSFQKAESRWTVVRDHTTRVMPRESYRTGPFNQVFDNDVAFVYSTHGSPAENAWSFAKARFDAEQLLVRGNGSVDVLADTEIPKNTLRNLVVYTCGKANLALELVMGDGFDPRTEAASKPTGDLAMLVFSPGRNRFTHIGVVEGSTLAGCRILDRIPYFVSGVGYPDWVLMSPAVLEKGTKGVLGAGFLGADWGYDASNSVWLP